MSFKDYKLLEVESYQHLKEINYFHPQTIDVISLETPALNVLSDFHTKQPQVIYKNALADDAFEKMQRQNVHSLMVTDDQDRVIGLVNAVQLQGLHKTQIAQKMDIPPKDVTAGMLLERIETLTFLNYNVVKDALVGHIARILNETNHDHLLVTDTDKNNIPTIRGIFSASFIAKRLGAEIGRDLSSSSIAEMNRII